jgi:GntR family transcriptional regulator
MVDNGVNSHTHIDRDSPIPLYYQLKQILLHHILDENAAPGESIPSEKELQDKYHLSRITVRRALSDLAAEGYVTREPGRGTFVRPAKLLESSQTLGGFVDDLKSQGLDVESRILKCGWQPPSPLVGEKLAADGCEVFYIKRLLLADGEPIALARGYLKIGKEIVLTADELNDTPSVYIVLEQKYGILLRRATKTIEASLPPEADAALLHISPSVPVLQSELVVYDERDRPAAYVNCLYRGDRYKYYLTVTR